MVALFFSVHGLSDGSNQYMSWLYRYLRSRHGTYLHLGACSRIAVTETQATVSQTAAPRRVTEYVVWASSLLSGPARAEPLGCMLIAPRETRTRSPRSKLDGGTIPAERAFRMARLPTTGRCVLLQREARMR